MSRISAVLRSSITFGLYPGLLLVSLWSSWGLLQWGLSPWMSAGAVVLAGALLIWALEWWHPCSLAWRPAWTRFSFDFIHTLLSTQGVAPLTQALTRAVLLGVGSIAVGSVGLGLWPRAWPLPLQVALAVLVADLFTYLYHRWMHQSNVGWRIHSVHHTLEQFHFLGAGRTHPLNAAVKVMLEYGVLVLLGITTEGLTLWTVFQATNGLLQHSNIELRTGFLSYLLGTPEAHQWHHSKVVLDVNFGNTTMVWDHLFRTFYLPSRRPEPDGIGLRDHRIPERLGVHLLAPFVLERYAQPNEAREGGSR